MDIQNCLPLILVYTCHLVLGDITVRERNDSTPIDTFSDAAAGFGPSVPNGGITGYVYNVMPRLACEPVKPPPDNTSVWIALISRNNCTFAAKVRNVQKWYAAAIIYDTQGERLRRMPGGQLSGCKESSFWNGIDPSENSDGTPVNIPAVFVGNTDGKMMEKLYCYHCKPEFGRFVITIDYDSQFIFNPYLLWPFAVVVGTCFVLMLVFILVKWCRDIRRRRKSRLSTKHLKKIPTKKFKKGDEYDVCAICLDDYEEGDKLRLLPCSHVYHTKCIDPWLTKNKRSCPICKRKVIPGDDPSSDSGSSDEGEGETQTERTPLLTGSSRSNNNNRRSTFDNSGLPEQFRQPDISILTEGHPQGQDGTDSNSDQSDSEVGAVGGVSRVRLAKENLMKTLKDSTLTNQNQSQTAPLVENHEVVIETSQGSDNHGYMVDGEDEESGNEYFFQDVGDVVYSDGSKKDEKKFNGVV